MLARLLVVVLAATQASGLAIAAPAACPAVAVRSNLRMALPSIDDANKLSDDELTQEIFNAKKVSAHDAHCPRTQSACMIFWCSFYRSPLLALSAPVTIRLQELFELRKNVKTRQQVDRCPSQCPTWRLSNERATAQLPSPIHLYIYPAPAKPRVGRALDAALPLYGPPKSDA